MLAIFLWLTGVVKSQMFIKYFYFTLKPNYPNFKWSCNLVHLYSVFTSWFNKMPVTMSAD